MNPSLPSTVDDTVSSKFTHLTQSEQSYTKFVNICNEVGKEILPKRLVTTKSENKESVIKARKETLRSNLKELQKNQKNLRKTFDKVEDERINSILSKFETTNTSENSDAWNLVKELSGKKSKSPIFIEADDRLDAWKSHFQNLLNAEGANTDNPDSIEKLFDVFPEI